MLMHEHDQRYIADTARVMGEVELGTDVGVWYGALIRGDVAKIIIGDNTNIQDNATIHCDHGKPNIIGSNVTIGHNAVVHGQAVGDGSLIGMHATVLGRTKIGKNCLIAAGAVVPPGLEVPDGMVVMGVPGKVPRSHRGGTRIHEVPPPALRQARAAALPRAGGCACETMGRTPVGWAPPTTD